MVTHLSFKAEAVGRRRAHCEKCTKTSAEDCVLTRTVSRSFIRGTSRKTVKLDVYPSSLRIAAYVNASFAVQVLLSPLAEVR